jgi:hypothetical protein
VSRPGRFIPREIPGTHCTGGWVGPRAGLDRCGKSRPHRDSIPGPLKFEIKERNSVNVARQFGSIIKPGLHMSINGRSHLYNTPFAGCYSSMWKTFFENCFMFSDSVYVRLKVQPDVHGFVFILNLIIFAVHVSGAICTHHQEQFGLVRT